MTGWLLAIAGPFAGLVGGVGIIVAVAIISIVEGPPPMRAPVMWLFVYLPVATALTCGLLAGGLLRRRSRQWFRALRPGARVGAIGGCWLLPALWFGAMMVTMMSL